MKEDRKEIIGLIEQATQVGARQSEACITIGISAKTLQRWSQEGNLQDGRLGAKHGAANKLTDIERQQMIAIANDAEYANLPMSKLAPCVRLVVASNFNF